MTITVTVEIAPGADITTNPDTWNWTDVSADVRAQERVSVKRGRQDASSQAEPARITFSVNNTAGNWTPDFPTGAYYPDMDLGLPVRVFVDHGSGNVLRGTCFVEQITPGWDTSLNVATASVTAAGLLRRYGQGDRPAQSLMTTHNLAALDSADNSFINPPVAYWPMEDASGSETFAEIMGTMPPMKWNETEPTFASSGPPGSKPVVKLASATELYADITPFESATQEWALTFVCKIPVGVSGLIPIVMINSLGTIVEWRICVQTGTSPDTIIVEGFNAAGTKVVNNSTDFDGASGDWLEPYGDWLLFRFLTYQNGANIEYSLTIVESETLDLMGNSGTVAGTWNIPTRIGVHNGWSHTDWIFGHFALYQNDIGMKSEIVGGWVNQTAADRMTYAALYEHEPEITFVGTEADTEVMGTWSVGTFVDTLQECERCDGGILYDAKTPNLEYRTRASRYNLTAGLTLDMDAGELAPPFSPLRDDQRLRNEVTVSRSGGNSGERGSSATVRDSASVDKYQRYPETVSINIDDDDLLVHHAGWRANLGTVSGMRYPSLSLDLIRSPSLAAAWVALDIGDRITVQNPPTQQAPDDIDLILEGYTEQFGVNEWYVKANCSPYQPWDTFIVGSATKGRIPLEGTALAATLNTTATSTTTTSDYLLTTTATFPGDFPFDLNIGGERVTVTAISGTSNPQTLTITRSVNGVVKSHASGDPVTKWQSSPISL